MELDSEGVRRLREEFDQAFGAPLRVHEERVEDVLALRVAGRPYALRLRDVAGLFADHTVVPFPSPLPELVGLAGVRGQLVPVYDLGAMLGHGGTGPARWWLLVAGAAPLGLSFEAFDGHARVGAAAFSASGPGGTLVQLGDPARPLLDLRSAVAGLSERIRRSKLHEEPSP